MAYKKKAEVEKEFVQELINAGGIDKYSIMDEGSNEYWCFWMNNGTQRFWTNLSEESQTKLGIGS